MRAKRGAESAEAPLRGAIRVHAGRRPDKKTAEALADLMAAAHRYLVEHPEALEK